LQVACLIVAPQRAYDEPAILFYAIISFCPTSADGLQAQHEELGRAGREAGVPARIMAVVLATPVSPSRISSCTSVTLGHPSRPPSRVNSTEMPMKCGVAVVDCTTGK